MKLLLGLNKLSISTAESYINVFTREQLRDEVKVVILCDKHVKTFSGYPLAESSSIIT